MEPANHFPSWELTNSIMKLWTSLEPDGIHVELFTEIELFLNGGIPQDTTKYVVESFWY